MIILCRAADEFDIALNARTRLCQFCFGQLIGWICPPTRLLQFIQQDVQASPTVQVARTDSSGQVAEADGIQVTAVSQRSSDVVLVS